MHYAFDKWMDREFPGCPFERYADDAVIHCDTEAQARHLRAALAERLGSVGLELHPVKTKIVYCKDTTRRKEASTPASTSSATPSGAGSFGVREASSWASTRP